MEGGHRVYMGIHFPESLQPARIQDFEMGGEFL